MASSALGVIGMRRDNFVVDGGAAGLAGERYNPGSDSGGCFSYVCGFLTAKLAGDPRPSNTSDQLDFQSIRIVFQVYDLLEYRGMSGRPHRRQTTWD